MSKFFQKMKEATGMVQASEDSPAVKESKEKLKQMKSTHDSIIRLSTKMVATGTKYGQDGENLATAFHDYGALDPEDPFGKTLQKMSEIQRAQDELLLALLSQVTESLVSPVKQFVEVDIKNCTELRNKHDDSRLGYDIEKEKNAALQKKQGEKWEEKKSEQNQATNLSRANWEQLQTEVVREVADLDRRSRIAISSSMLSFLRAQHQFYSKGLSTMNDLFPFMESLEHNIKALQQAPRGVNVKQHLEAPPQQSNDPPPPTYNSTATPVQQLPTTNIPIYEQPPPLGSDNVQAQPNYYQQPPPQQQYDSAYQQPPPQQYDAAYQQPPQYDSAYQQPQQYQSPTMQPMQHMQQGNNNNSNSNNPPPL